MVDLTFIEQVAAATQSFFLHKTADRVVVDSELILVFVPEELLIRDAVKKYKIILSARTFDDYTRKEIISGLFAWLKTRLTVSNFQKIRSIIPPHSKSSYGRSVHQVKPLKPGMKSLNNTSIGGYAIDFGVLVYMDVHQDTLQVVE